MRDVGALRSVPDKNRSPMESSALVIATCWRWSLVAKLGYATIGKSWITFHQLIFREIL